MSTCCEQDGQPEWCRKRVEAGWRFSYDPATRFVSAEHPLGGKQSVAEIMRIGRTGFDADEVGRRLAAMLNIEFSDLWTVGTALANAIGVPRTTLISAVDAGHIPWKLLGSGEPVVRLDDAKKWAEGRR